MAMTPCMRDIGEQGQGPTDFRAPIFVYMWIVIHLEANADEGVQGERMSLVLSFADL